MKSHELVSWFQTKYPKLVKVMEECSHHNGIDLNDFHLEGSVWTHTLMVLNQLPESSSKVVKIAALLHDIGKPLVREVSDKGRVRFFNHESVGAFLALSILKDPFLELDEEEIVQVFKLICLHTEPYKLTSDQLNELLTDEIALSSMLRDLSLADHKGRFTSVESELPDFTYNYNNSSSSVFNKELIVLVGLPTSGKSTYASELQKQGYTVISRDHIITSMCPDETYNKAYSMVDKAIVNSELSKLMNKHKKTDKVVIDMTNLTKSGRRKLLKQFPYHNKKCVVFLTDLITIEKRNSSREGKFISSEVIERMIKSFYVPMKAEGFTEIEWRIT